MKTKKCIKCTRSIPLDARLCPYCGEILKLDLPAEPKNEQAEMRGEQTLPKKDRKGYAVASLVVGASFFVFLFLAFVANHFFDDSGVFGILTILSPLLSVPGIILGILGLKSSRKRSAITGIMLNSFLFFLLIIYGCLATLLSMNWRG